MNYVKWKGRIDICGMFLLLFLLLAVLLLPVGIDDFQKKNYIPIEIKYPLSEIPEDQAVLVESIWKNGISWSETYYDLVVNKEGRWKLLDYSEMDIEEYNTYMSKAYRLMDEHDFIYYDYILQDDNIPWQDEKITIDPYFLERALNMPEVDFEWEHQSPGGMSSRIAAKTNWFLIDDSSQRLRIDYNIGSLLNMPKYEHTVTYMQNKMKQIDSLGLQIYAERHQIPVNTIKKDI